MGDASDTSDKLLRAIAHQRLAFQPLLSYRLAGAAGR